MEIQRRSSSNPSGGARWSRDSIELEQPSLRLLTPGAENHEQNFRIADATSISEEISNDGDTQISRDIDGLVDPKARTAGLHSPTQPRAKDRSILLEWSEEILSVTIAVVCTALSIAVLAYMNERSLDEWKLRLQPNTLIALLATVTRAALIYPLAECLGYLKWRYFERPRTLAHLQKFDAASRGPLGAIKYLWTVPIRSPLATCAAILTTLLLFFQPFAQQTINFASRPAPMPNETAQAFQATSWNTSSFGNQSASREPLFPALTYGLYKAISRDAVDGSNNGHCSSSLCQFADFDTLAVCSKCEERILSGSIDNLFDGCYMTDERGDNIGSVTFGQNSVRSNETTANLVLQDVVETKLQETWNISVTCGNTRVPDYDFELPLISIYIAKLVNPPKLQVVIHPLDRSESRPKVVAEMILDTTDNPLSFRYESGAGFVVVKPEPDNSLSDTCRPTTQFPSFTPEDGLVLNTIMNTTCLSFSTDLKLWFREKSLSDQFGFLNGTETKCSLTPCVQRAAGVRLQNNRYTTQSIRQDTSWYYSNMTQVKEQGNWDFLEGPFCSGDDDECLYSWTPDALRFLGSWLNSTIDTSDFYTMYMAQENGPRSNYTLFYERVAAQVSAVLQSQANPGITNITGIAYGTEIYVQVNWLWFILPLVLLTSCLIILVLSIWDSSRKDYLFKNNILAATAFQLHGWEPHEYGVDETWTRHGMRNVEKKAERMVARMQLPHEDDGGLRLKRE